MKKITVICMVLFVSITYSQITFIPDPEFENYLLQIGVDTDGSLNGQVFTSDIEDEIDLLFPWGAPEIKDLTGIEDFTSLEILDIFSVNIAELNIANNFNLRHLILSDVSLTSLDVSNNIELELLYIFNNNGGLFMSTISSLDFSNNSLLIACIISGASITNIDFSQNNNLGSLNLDRMEELTSINLKNGNNINLGLVRIENNISLECVQVDDPAAVIAGVNPPYDNWIIENEPIITDNCQLGISDNTLANSISIFPNPVSNILNVDNTSTTQIVSIKIYDVLGRLVLQEKEQFNNIDVSQLTSGLLFVHLETEQGTLTKKVVKE
jgi:hypothetical protein